MEQKSFYVYKSSAGSGKTYTLVKEYLKIVLEDPTKIRNILAITFTNAAAAEMKERIIAALGELSSLAGMDEDQRPPSATNMLNSILKETNLQSAQIIGNARLALTLILHNYGDFSVSTIDSFAHRIIRSFAFDLRLPLNFDVELDQDQLLSQAIDLLVSRAGKEPALTQLLVEYIELRTDEERSHYIEYDMARLAKTLMDEKGSLYVDRLKDITLDDFGRIHRNLATSIRKFEQSVQQKALEARELIEKENIPDEMFYRGKPGIGTWFGELAKGNIAEKINPNTYVQKTIEEDKWTAGKAKADVVAAIESISGQLKEIYLQIEALTQSGLVHFKVHNLVKKHLFPMAVLCELEKVLDDIKSEHSLLHISDFNKKISEIVSVESAPFIYERIGERYQHYMIDEFQDTSGLQWQNLLPLIDNSLASNHVNLVVGDGKQAIYRWRNGDVEQFAALPKLLPSITAESRLLWQQNLERNHKPFPLDTNWRSLPEIIDFNNRFFEFASQYLPDDLKKIYEGHAQKKHPHKTGGYIQIEFPAATPEENLDYRDNTHQRILEIIHELKANQHPLNDITILCRSNGEASSIARYLLEKRLNVISSESLLLSQSPKVNFILSVMRLINHPGDEVSLTEFLQFLASTGRISMGLHESLKQLKHGQSENKEKTISLEEVKTFLQQQGIHFSFQQCLHLGLYELGETIVRGFFGSRPVDPFIAFFMDVLYDYNNRFVSTLSDFLEWWQENAQKHSVVVPEGVDAVQVMTIHKSKGLQFPVVIYPFVDKDFSRPGKEGEWVELEDMDETRPLDIAWLSISSAMEGTPWEEIWQKEKGKTLLDLLNVTYVAFTRAVSKLFILSKYPDSGKFSDKNLAGFLHNFLVQENLWQESTLLYSLGENTPAVMELQEHNIENTASIFEEYISTPWAGKISVRSRQLELHEDRTTASERGSRIHEIMEHIHTAEDVDIVLDKLFQSGQMDSVETGQLKAIILDIVSHPLINTWFAKGIRAKNECGMYDAKGRFFRADRVILSNETAVVMDYKTGTPHPSHALQIQNYASIIEKMGYTDVKKYLVYLDHNNVELV
ncbi:MAG: hypothetical protein EA361_10520 [Bacteroidetes bacterium]|nr:MAG: hypothetical protein EA361_10520 [Bacteroidota bacterium]